MPDAAGSVIRLLPEDVANKIAAGEVVERPASVVKELLENALDAGARRIRVTIVAGGRRLVSVSDDGCGMNRDDALLAPQRQATSKLRRAEDLESIETMGFRGEALPSIASVSRFMLVTRRAGDSAGTRVEINGGVLADVSDCGAPPGTCVEVRDLFYNLPARRAFLRSYATEQAHVRAQFLVHAIAWPHVAMELVCDGDAVSRLQAASSRGERIEALFGTGFLSRFFPVEHADGDIRVSGWAGRPDNTRGDTAGQYVFINGRPATAPIVQAAIRESYQRLPAGRRPVVFLFIDVPGSQVDVNVHPAKREVRFRAAAAVRDAVLAALALALRGAEPDAEPTGADFRGGTFAAGSAAAAAAVPAPPPVRPSPLPPHPAPPPPALPRERPATPGANVARGEHPLQISTPANSEIPAAPPLRPPAPPIALAPPPIQTFFTPVDDTTFLPTGTRRPDNTPAGIPAGADTAAAPAAPTPQRRHSGLASAFRLIGQLRSGYILVETPGGGFAVVDPAAARERIAYERLMHMTSSDESASQALLLPQTVQLPPLDAQRVRSLLPVFESMGFDIEDFGGDTFVVRALPDAACEADARMLLEETARAFAEAGPKRGRERWREERIAVIAAREAGRSLKLADPREIETLLLELASCRQPYATPGGRPTMVHYPLGDVERRLGRR